MAAGDCALCGTVCVCAREKETKRRPRGETETSDLDIRPEEEKRCVRVQVHVLHPHIMHVWEYVCGCQSSGCRG